MQANVDHKALIDRLERQAARAGATIADAAHGGRPISSAELEACASLLELAATALRQANPASLENGLRSLRTLHGAMDRAGLVPSSSK